MDAQVRAAGAALGRLPGDRLRRPLPRAELPGRQGGLHLRHGPRERRI